jgi:hypothetical protein
MGPIAKLAAIAAIMAATIGGGQAVVNAMSSGPPEYVAEALAALQHGKAASAKKDLQMALASRREPKDARGHAREALDALDKGDTKTAKKHATNGAAVEHLTYALRALNVGHLTGSGSAEDHLGESVHLRKVHKQALAAIKAIKRHDVKAARKQIVAGLEVANKE